MNISTPKVFEYQDKEYPFFGFDKERVVVRALLKDKDGNYALHKLSRDDMFCKQSYYETPGGGVKKNETLEEALIRECEEELGLIVKPIKEIAIVKDAYNLIKTRNINHYFYCEVVSKSHMNLNSIGDSLIVSSSFLPLKTIIGLYEKMGDRFVSGLVKQRELPIWKSLESL